MNQNRCFYVFALMGLAALLAGCTPSDEAYCRAFGVGGTPEFGKCLTYYHQQQSLFDRARDLCESKADMTYPQSLYDHGHLEPVIGGTFYAGRYYTQTQYVQVGPDYQHNAELDRLRMRIVAPCMDDQGWNSPDTWQAGTHAIVKPRANALPRPTPLPWQ